MTRKMKDSGIEWIGEIPEDWKTTKLLFALDRPITDGPHETPSYVDEGVPFITINNIDDAGNIDKGNANKISHEDAATYNKKAKMKVGDLLFSKSATIGRIAEVDKLDFMVWSPFAILSPNTKVLDKHFLKLLLSLPGHVDHLIGLGSVNTQVNIGMRDMEKSIIPLPNIEYQIKISKFLIKKTKKLDCIKSLLIKEIQNLEDYKKSVITEAVTKGLDKNVEMKDSGIECIGDIPKHWSKIKLRYLSNIVRGGSPRPINEYMSNSDEDLNWIKIGDTQKGSKYINKTKNKLKITGLSSTTFVKKGELILSNSMSYGEAYILNLDGCIHDGWLAFKDIKNIDKEYLYFSLLSSNTKIQFDKLSDGGVVQNLNIDKVKTVYVFLSDKKEQVEIANYLNKTIKSIDKAIEGKQKQLETLEEYKKSLIYEYVTGKKEVKDGEET